LGAGAHRVLVGVDPHRVRREIPYRGEPLRHRRLVVERQGRPGGGEGREPAEVPAGEPATMQVPPLLGAEQVLHDSSRATRRGMGYRGDRKAHKPTGTHRSRGTSRYPARTGSAEEEEGTAGRGENRTCRTEAPSQSRELL